VTTTVNGSFIAPAYPIANRADRLVRMRALRGHARRQQTKK